MNRKISWLDLNMAMLSVYTDKFQMHFVFPKRNEAKTKTKNYEVLKKKLVRTMFLYHSGRKKTLCCCKSV